MKILDILDWIANVGHIVKSQMILCAANRNSRLNDILYNDTRGMFFVRRK